MLTQDFNEEEKIMIIITITTIIIIIIIIIIIRLNFKNQVLKISVRD